MIGQQVQQFKIVEKLGAGGMGEVFVAEDTRLKRRVALKFLPPHYSGDPDFKARFEHEATAAAALNHPNIITVYELGLHESRLFIALELVEGETLEQVIASGDLKTQRAIEIATQLCDGLSAAHEAGIVHRDIKPANILIDKAGRVKILDFGLAKSKRATTETREGTTVGTVQYESPEQGRGDQVDGRSDLFSLGVLLYEMVAGRRPFDAEFEDAVRYSIANENPEPLTRYKEGVPDELQRIVSKLLEKDPDLRFQSAAGVISDLKLLRRESGPSAVRSAVRPAASRPSRTPFLMAGLVALAVVAVLWVFNPWSVSVSPTKTAEAAEDRLAVMYFDNVAHPDDPRRLGEIAANLIITDLTDSRQLQVVSSQRLYDILRQIGHEGEKRLDQNMATEVASKAKARWMLMGTILQEEPQLVVTTQVVDVSTGDNVASQRITGAPGENIFTIVDRVTSELRSDLLTPEAIGLEADRPVAEVTSSSSEAYAYYLEGVELDTKLFTAEASQAFKRALAIDSNMAMAWYGLAKLEYVDASLRLEHIERAKSLVDRVSEKDRLYIDAVYARAHGNFSEVVDTYEELLGRFPDEKEAAFELGEQYQLLLQHDNAVVAYQRAIAIDPTWKSPYNSLAYAHEINGNYDKAIESINEYIRLAPEEPNPYDSRGDLYSYRGYWAEALQSYRKALEIKPDFASIAKMGDMALFLGDARLADSCFRQWMRVAPDRRRAESRMSGVAIPLLEGRLNAAIDFLGDALAASRLDGDEGIGVQFILLLQARLYESKGEEEKALAAIDQAQKFHSKHNPLEPTQWRQYLAMNFIHQSRLDEADSIVEAMGHDIRARDSSQLFYYWSVRASLASARGQHEKALENFDRIGGSGVLMTLYQQAQALLALNRPDEAIVALTEASTNYWQFWRIGGTWLAECQYWLGVAHEQAGRPIEAVARYEKFLHLYHNADYDAPYLKEAQNRLAALKSTS